MLLACRARERLGPTQAGGAADGWILCGRPLGIQQVAHCHCIMQFLLQIGKWPWAKRPKEPPAAAQLLATEAEAPPSNQAARTWSVVWPAQKHGACPFGLQLCGEGLGVQQDSGMSRRQHLHLNTPPLKTSRPRRPLGTRVLSQPWCVAVKAQGRRLKWG